MNRSATDVLKDLLQLVGVVGMTVIVALVVHKGSVDVWALAQKHSGADFWRALAQYLLRNLAGGS